MINIFLRRTFLKLREYAREKQRNRIFLRKACKAYFKTLFKKTISSLKANQNKFNKHFWFKIIKRQYLRTQLKAEITRKQHDQAVLSNFFETWFLLQKEQENLNYLVYSMLQFYTLRLKSKSFTALELNKNSCKESRNNIHQNIINKKMKYFDGWKNFYKRATRKKINRGRAFELYYFSLLKKGFYEWIPCCQTLKREAKEGEITKKFFYGWKSLYMENETNKTKAISQLRSRILKKISVRKWKLQVWSTKRLNLAKKFYLYRRFLEWKLAVSTIKYGRQSKQKAVVWSRWRLEKKYFERLYTNFRKEKMLNKEYQIKVYQCLKGHNYNLVKQCYQSLSYSIVIKHVKKIRTSKVLSKFFKKWILFIYNTKLRRHKVKEYHKRMRLAKLFTVFEWFKNNWLNFRRKDILAIQGRRALVIRRTFEKWLSTIFIKLLEDESKAVRNFHFTYMRKAFYLLHMNVIKMRKQKLFEERLDWFIEKKIRKLLQKIIRKLYIWAKANIKHRQITTTILYHVFYNLKLHCKLRRIDSSSI